MPSSRAIVVLLIVLPGCAHTHYMGSLSEEETVLLERQASSGRFRVQMLGGPALDGTELVVAADSLTWQTSGQQVREPWGNVEQVTFRDHVAGGVEGFMYGAVGGFVAGSVWAYMGAKNCSNCWDPGASAVMGGAIIGLGSGLVGAVFGTGLGTQDKYIPASRP